MTVDQKAQVANAREEQQMSSENDEQNSAEVDLRTPEEWCQIERVQILDADGWRGRDGRDWTDPISLAEFQQRLATCTQRSIPAESNGTYRNSWQTIGQKPNLTQPAGEHHTGTLDLTGEGNAPEFTVEALHDEICRTYGAIWSPDNLAEILARHGWVKASETRQQVAEEIAVALEGYTAHYPEDIFPPDGESRDAVAAAAMRHAYPNAARIAREIGGVA